MKKPFSVSDLMELTVDERIELVEDLWDSIGEMADSIELTDEQKNFLDERLAQYNKNPDEGSPWEIVRARIRENK